MSALTVVTEDRVTVTAGGAMSSEAEVRASAGFKEAEVKANDSAGSDPAGAKSGEKPEAADAKSDTQSDKVDKSATESLERDPATGQFKPKTDDKGDPRKSVQAKINEERRLRGDAERKAAELEARVAAAEAKLAAGTKPTVPAVAGSPADARAEAKPPTYLELVKKYQAESDWPTLEQAVAAGFDDPYAATSAAQAAYIGEKQQADREARAAEAHEAQERDVVMKALYEAGAAKYQDWDDVLNAQAELLEMKYPGYIDAAIHADSQSSADIVYHLLSHPDEFKALMVMSDPIAAVMEVARIRYATTGLSTAHSGPEIAPRQTKAKPLIKPVGASPAAPEASSPDELPFGPGYIKAMNERERKQRETRSGT
jgi:hypothetical protein